MTPTSIQEYAEIFGAENCPNCGKLDMTYGLSVDKNGKSGLCILCEAPVKKYSSEKSLIYALEVFKVISVKANEVKNDALKTIISRAVDGLLSPLYASNKMPSSKEITQFQALLKGFNEVNFGGPNIGGFIKFKNGEASPTFVDNNLQEKYIYALFSVVMVINYLQELKINNEIENKKNIDVATVSIYFNKLLKNNKNIFGKTKSEVTERINAWLLKNPNSIITHKIKNKLKIEVGELPADMNIQTLADIYTLHHELLNYPFKQ